MIKLIIAGGRDFNEYPLLRKETIQFFMDNFTNFNEEKQCIEIERHEISIISGQEYISTPGKKHGADYLGERFAKEFDLPIIPFPADWTTYGKSAGPRRNEEMAKIATHCIVFWDQQSRGSKNMIENARKYNLILKVVNY